MRAETRQYLINVKGNKIPCHRCDDESKYIAKETEEEVNLECPGCGLGGTYKKTDDAPRSKRKVTIVIQS